MAKRREQRKHTRVDHPGGEEAPIRFELFSNERLVQHAISLAKAQKATGRKEGQKLIPRVSENSRVLRAAYKAISQAIQEQHAITPAAEWLLDNFHVIEEQVTDIDLDLPESYYRELPKLAGGVLAGYPRIYGVAWALVAHTDSRFAPELLNVFVKAYQTVEPLTIGELWAIPITLRVLLIENLRRIAVRIMRSQSSRKMADEFVDHIERMAAQTDKSDLSIPEAILPSEPLRQAYAVQILQRLHEPHPGAVVSLEFLNEWLAGQEISLDEIVHREHADQIADNQTVRNIITSMRAISVFEWPQFVEDVSLVDECLHAYDGYRDMDFLTRDRYRHAIEDLAKRSRHSELEIARKVIAKVKVSSEGPAIKKNQQKLEPGYYLIGAGRYKFEQEMGYRPTFKQRLLRVYVSHAGLAYVGSLILLTLLLLALPFGACVSAGLNGFQLFLLTLFSLFPASDLAVGLMNRFIIGSLPPRHLPRLSLKQGLPEALSTFVVVPTLFVNLSGVKEQIDQLEIRYLSNPENHVCYALLSDWSDADQETMPNDRLLLDTAQDGVAALNAKYGGLRFFVYHRKRLWNPSEGKWMGWERKRGKLHEFNRLLRGATDTTFISNKGETVLAPPGVCYVITLDADTKLPMGVVSQLVGVAAHPLNQPVFDPVSQCVVDGYGIFQPRVTPTLPHRQEHSMFHQLFAGASGTDAYASSVSELYQDLFALGTYSGKGLYHVDSFESALAGRVPENTLLSHDLFESIFTRCALVSDVEIFEEFPSHTGVAASREHRWVRGDWQLLPWIFGSFSKGMPAIGRLKMLDNLRRSLSAPGAFFTLVATWAIPDAPAMLLIGFVLTALAFPVILAFFDAFKIPRRGISISTHLRSAGEKIGWSIANSLVALILLSQQAWRMIDAIVSTLVRLFITRRRLLKWVTVLQVKSTTGHSLNSLIRPLGSSFTIVAGAGALVLLLNPSRILVATPFLFLWWLAPVVARILSLPPRIDRAEILLPEDGVRLRLIGRRIWRFFTTFVTKQENFLPPDNFQEDPRPVIAHRSSPTNFGLYLLSVVAARDFGWIGCMDSVMRIEDTVKTLTELPRLRGHFYNWYDTQDLHVLEPPYISTVDSGNLAGHLITLAQANREMLGKPLDFSTALIGVSDAYRLLLSAIEEVSDDRRTHTVTLKEIRDKIVSIGDLLDTCPTEAEKLSEHWRQLKNKSDTLVDVIRSFFDERKDDTENELLSWAILLRDDLLSHSRDIDNLIPWVHFRGGLTGIAGFEKHDQPSIIWHGLSLDTPLGEMASCYRGLLNQLETSGEVLAGIDKASLLECLTHALAQVEMLTSRIEALTSTLETLFHEMEFNFLYDTTCNMFSLGYRVPEATLDPSCYDLLASEARLSSFVAIAKREVPSTHWLHLGRRVTRAVQGSVLLSWSGSMFEYLMPSLVMFTPRYSILDQTCRLVVKRQVEYGQERGVPWGISESAFNGRDLYFTYQYSAFGIPGLGMKRGLGEELVVAPYATALGAMYFPHDAAENFERLETEGALGRYGFYEALDFTPLRLAEGQRVAVVRCYMAHHQGMSLVAFSNVVHDGAMRHRFHSAPLIQAAELLLQERIPIGAETDTITPEFDLAEVKETLQPPVRRIPSPTSSSPSAHLLSNGRYTVMVTAAGSGYSLWKQLAITRWREDTTRDAWGSFIYLRDIASKRVWSAGYHPTTALPDSYDAFFAEDRVRISRTDGSLASVLEIIISTEDDAEIRRLSLTNHGSRSREIEITSYAEIVIAPMPADIAHPAFSNLFVHTEHVPQVSGLIAQRRPRLSSDPIIWAAHVLAGHRVGDGLQYETDRSRFVGRGQTLREPVAVVDGRPLTNTVGAVLDPIFSLRTRIRIPPGSTAQLTFTTLVGASREAVIEAAEKYCNIDVYNRASSMAWTHAQVQLHHLRTRADEAQLFQDIASRLIYLNPSLRPSGKLMQMNTMNVTELWRYGISGDRPIVLLRVKEPEDRLIVEQLLRAHEYWRMKGLAVDLVVLNEKESSYVDHLQILLETLVRESQAISAQTQYENHGAIFVIRSDQLSIDQRRLLQSAARVMLVSNRGTLAEQLLRHFRPESDYVETKRLSPSAIDSPRLESPPLEFFNGLGGFAEEGREYVIVLDNNQWTPVPWVNVIANADIGFIVSESGSGCTWCGNSRENQLTPWSNDPVSDPPGEVFYIRDDETNELWNPTVLPIRVNNASYIIHHGQGYSRFEHCSHGIHSDLLQFVSPDDPVKISVLTLKNVTNRTRRLTLTAYVEWVLGPSRTVTAPHIITEFDSETKALFAYNPWDAEFGQRIAFADIGGQQTGWTCNRTEFIGRNGSLSAPTGLLKGNVLKNRVGAGLDACAVFDTAVFLNPNESIELVFLIGQGNGRDHASELIKRYRAIRAATTFIQVKESWEHVLGKVQVKTPDRALDIQLNGWLLYQTLSCRMWARAGFYQVGGAYGFRDQLQDSMALAVARPDLTRAHLLRAAAHQFGEGDVQHWWHPPSGRGVRTRFSDDRVWLPYVVAHYIKVSGDIDVLEEKLPFLEGIELGAEQDDAYFEPTLSQQLTTLFEHCARALDISMETGSHGLPLMGSGDWNDGMNRVGNQGKGESVWLAWFLIATLSEFVILAETRGDDERVIRWRQYVTKLKLALETEAWDGAWYRRAYYDDGTPLGSATNTECRIDSIAQSWGVISGAAGPERAKIAMNSVREYLVRQGDELVLLFTPPFNKTERDPGYIKSYPPGIRENGGQYTHAAIWSVIAYAMLGEGDQAAELLHMLNPINRTATRTGVFAYKVEPYVLAADIYAEPPHTRRGGWTWYTGASGWYYRAGMEWILGLQVRADCLIFDPCIPKAWRSYSIFYQHANTRYEITVENPNGVSRGIATIELDGALQLPLNSITLLDDGLLHRVRVLLGK